MFVYNQSPDAVPAARGMATKIGASMQIQCSKTCIACGQDLPPDSFYRHPMMRDGRINKCMECCRSEARRRPYVNRHSYWVAYPQKNPDKINARRAVMMAVRAGRLPKVKTQSCSDCGEPAAHYDHYKGYEKEHRLDVEPVCTLCHGRRGRERREQDQQP